MKMSYYEKYLFTYYSSAEVQCIVCFKINNVDRSYNIKRHYELCHKKYFCKFEGEELQKEINILKIKYEEERNQNVVDRALSVKTSMSAAEKNVLKKSQLKASYLVSLALAKQCRPFTDGMFHKQVLKIVVECFGEKVQEQVDTLQGIPLSKDTIRRRTEEISSFIYANTKKKISECKYFAICLDESTDIKDLCQLVIGIKFVDADLNTSEEILNVVSIKGNVKGSTIYDVVDSKLLSFCEKSKLSSVCTDGANVMTGKKTGFVGFLLKNKINVPTFHCIIHQQVLCSKSISTQKVMEISIKIINKIRGGHKLFKT